MATGDSNDIVARIKATLPPWFGNPTPILDALISGLANAWSFFYSLYSYVKLQTRISTATDGFLDLIASDFFGIGLLRNGRSDSAYRSAIRRELFREKTTRKAIHDVIVDLTGNEPIIFEPARPQDTGAYNTNSIGYGVAGGYGTLTLPFQAFVTVIRPVSQGIPLVAGYGISSGAYTTSSRSSYASLDDVIGRVKDSDIYSAIDSVKPAATIIWTKITGDSAEPDDLLGSTFILGSSRLHS